MTYVIEAFRDGSTVGEGRAEEWEAAVRIALAFRDVAFPRAAIVVWNMDRPRIAGDGLEKDQREELRKAMEEK